MTRYIRNKYSKFKLWLSTFKTRLTFSLIKRNYKPFPTLRSFVKYTNDPTHSGQIDMLETYKKGLDSAEPPAQLRDITKRARKSELNLRGRVLLFLADKLVKPKRTQRETRVYRNKETKKVTVVNRVKEIK